jgi:uncharacterized protein (TIGR00369 family)
VTLKSDGGCFVCGEKNSAGLHVKFDVNRKRKTIEAEHLFSETYQGYDGIVHGGILSLLLDEAMVKLAFAVGLPAVTGEITVRFPSPLRPGERVWVQGRIVREDRRIVLTEARAEKEDGTIVAEAHARLFRKKEGPLDTG